MAVEGHLVGLPNIWVDDDNEQLEDVTFDVASLESAELDIERVLNKERDVVRTIPREFVVRIPDLTVRVRDVGRSQMTSICGMSIRDAARIENDTARKEYVERHMRAFGGKLVFKCIPVEQAEGTVTDRVAISTVTTHYAPVPNSRIVETVEKVCEEKGLAILSRSSYNTPMYYGMRFMFEDNVNYDLPPGGHNIQQAPEGAHLQCGVEVRTSLIARHSLSAGAFFVNSVCTNGLIVSTTEDLMNRKHMGETEDLLEMLAVNVGGVIDARFGIVERIKNVREVEVNELVKKKIVLLAMKRANVSQKAMMMAIAVTEAGEHASAETSVWGAVNVLTGIATHGGVVNSQQMSLNRAAEDLIDNHAGYITDAEGEEAGLLLETIVEKKRLYDAKQAEKETIE